MINLQKNPWGDGKYAMLKKGNEAFEATVVKVAGGWQVTIENTDISGICKNLKLVVEFIEDFGFEAW